MIRYGHRGRPVIAFTRAEGDAADFEKNGMVAALAPLVEAGRAQLFCVETFDDLCWADRSAPMDERASNYRAFESWITKQVWEVVEISASAGVEAIAWGCDLGACHALHLGLTRPDLFPVVVAHSGNYDPTRAESSGKKGQAYFVNPSAYARDFAGAQLDWLRDRLRIVMTVGKGAWEVTPTGALASSREMAALLQGKGLDCELDIWGVDSGHDWPAWQQHAAKHLARFV